MEKTKINDFFREMFNAGYSCGIQEGNDMIIRLVEEVSEDHRNHEVNLFMADFYKRLADFYRRESDGE